MSSDEEEEVYLQQGKDEPEAFSLVDANRAKKVQERFCLPHEPACVFTKANKRTEFGKLKGGRLYKLEEEEKIPDTKSHTQNAMMLAKAVYHSDPATYLLIRQPHNPEGDCGLSELCSEGDACSGHCRREENPVCCLPRHCFLGGCCS